MALVDRSPPKIPVHESPAGHDTHKAHFFAAKNYIHPYLRMAPVQYRRQHCLYSCIVRLLPPNIARRVTTFQILLGTIPRCLQSYPGGNGGLRPPSERQPRVMSFWDYKIPSPPNKPIILKNLTASQNSVTSKNMNTVNIVVTWASFTVVAGGDPRPGRHH